MKKRVFIVDDHPLLRKGLSQLIDGEADLKVVGEAEDAPEALRKVVSLKPDVAIVDISLHGFSGIELIKQLRKRTPSLPVLVLSIHDESLYAERALRAGAQGYIMKEEANDRVLTALRRVMRGEIYLSKRMSERLLQLVIGKRPDPDGRQLGHLSDRELEVFQMIGQGFSTREIAEKLFLSVKTVETYRAKIKEKLQIQNASQLVQRAVLWHEREAVPEKILL